MKGCFVMKIKKILLAVVAVIMVLSCFSGCSGEVVNPETFGIDSFIEGHAKFVLGDIETDMDFVEYASDCLASHFCTCNLPGTFYRIEGSKTIKWQINKVIMRSDWKKNVDAFLYPEPIGDNYPVFFTYVLNVDGQKTEYMARATQNPEKDNKWEVDLVMMPNPDQLKHITKDLSTNNWHTVEKA